VTEQDSHAAQVSFGSLVLWLGQMAAVSFGDIADPGTGQAVEPNLPAARQMIELLAMLQEKTKGNLAAEEVQLLDELLYELRIRYVDAERADKRIITP
jgi:Domain of unknown function (DUF1844)